MHNNYLGKNGNKIIPFLDVIRRIGRGFRNCRGERKESCGIGQCVAIALTKTGRFFLGE